jgi:hypothetical protein
MKQSWQRLPGDNTMPQNIPFERNVCIKAGFVDDRIMSAEYVFSENRVVDTLNFIRKNIPGEVTSFKYVLKKSNADNSQEHPDPYVVNRTVHETPERFGKEDAAVQPTCRTQTRIFMKIRGWPIKYFKSLEEFLRVILDAINGILTSLS